jgi:hypothetical protein
MTSSPMRPRRHLLVALHERSWGRAEMAVRVARELRSAGDEARFLLHTTLLPLVHGAGFDAHPVADHMGGMVRLALDTLVRQVQPQSVIYFDYLNTCNYLLGLGVDDPSFLLEYPCTIASLDTWDAALTGTRVDLFGESEGSLALGDVKTRTKEFDRIVHRLIPVPMAPCDPKAGRFACLPALTPGLQPGSGPAHDTWRRRLNIPETCQYVLFCSSEWQRIRGTHQGARRVVQLVSRLLGVYLGQLGSEVHLVHVGPQPYPLEQALGQRYHWVPPLGRAEFEQIVAASDLLLSANVSATTLAWAIQMGVPAVVLQNSRMLRNMEAVESMARERLSEAARRLWSKALPVYPFRLWPLGYYAFLQPLLENNAYTQALETVEIVDESAVVSTCQALLFEPAVRQASARRQGRYVEQVAALPSAAEVVRGFCS